MKKPGKYSQYSGANPSSGFTMIESLFVVGAAMILFLAGFGLYKLAVNNTVTTTTIRLITTIKGQTQVTYANDGTYGVISLIPTLVAKESFPAGVLNALNVPIDPWDNPIAIMGNNQVFDITFPRVPSAFCIRLGSAFTQADTDFSSLSVGPTVFDDANPVLINPLTAACTTAANVPMVWSFF